ncbi:MAG: hypothetical protein QOJ77_1928, partial [Microbacteriaceae bacterium]|nr:hypothetical protein [Microbacteriaceae bacterium]
ASTSSDPLMRPTVHRKGHMNEGPPHPHTPVSPVAAYRGYESY